MGIEGQIPINAAAFSKMKTNAVIVNVARGAIIEEAALYAALKSKRIAGGGDRYLGFGKQ